MTKKIFLILVLATALASAAYFLFSSFRNDLMDVVVIAVVFINNIIGVHLLFECFLELFPSGKGRTRLQSREERR